MSNNTPKMKTIKLNVRHNFTGEDRQILGGELARAIGGLRGIETEFDAVKKSFNSKIGAAEAQIDKLSTDITNGFEYRDKPCVRVYDLSAGKKRFYLESEVAEQIEKSGKFDPAALVAVITEELTAEDRQQELIDAEDVFEGKESIDLFPPTGADSGVLIVGRLNEKWYTACRVTIGKHMLTDRLDSEQKAAKARPDAIKQAVKKYAAWLVEKLGKDTAKGFENHAALAVASHAEREE